MRKYGMIGLLIGITCLAKAQYQPVYFTYSPTIDATEENIVFVLKGDLWQVPIRGGYAVRLTALEGQETQPLFSPDGKWIAFTSNQFGNEDVFLMDRAGGAIRQLTFHDADDQVASWSWDSQHIYFTSSRLNRFSSYRISIEGGSAERVFSDNYFQTDHQLAEHPVTGELFFSETWESSFFTNRKRYKGAYNPDVQSYNPKDGTLKKYTDWEGKDFWVTIDKAGHIYFVSDEANGEYNLYTLKNGSKTQLTNFDTSIKNPQVSAAGNKIVFEKDYQLFLYDVPSGQAEKVNVQVPALDVLVKPQDFSTSSHITAFDVAPDNKKLAFVSRGRIFISDVEGKFIQPLSTLSAEKVEEVHWLEDSKTLLYSQTVDGYLNWFTQPAMGEGPEKQLTTDTQNNRNLTFNSDRSQAVYLSGREEVRLLDLSSFISKTIVRDELWALYNPAPYFSPDDAYVVFTAMRAFERDILVYHLSSGKTTNLTQTGLTETDPFWSPDGKYLYFVADRKQPSYPYGPEDPNLYRLPLQKFDEPFRTTQWEKLFEENTPFTVKMVIPDGPADKEGKDILPGDKLIGVNGTAADTKNNREQYFLQPSMDQEMKLTFQRGTRTFEVLLHPVSSEMVSNLRYDQWIAKNQQMVDSLTDKKVAYVYMKNMSGNALADFYKEMTSEAYRRDGLILDLRYNTGGNVHDEVLRFLSRKSYLQWKYREGALTPQSNFSPADKPMVLLINEQTLSDGEMTATGWKALKLGPVIGTETYRWIIFTTGKTLVDGSFYRLPSWGCYTLEGDDLEKTGVTPDIPVEMNFKHRQDGEDPQLRRAIEEVLE